MQSSLSFCIYELNLAPCWKALRHLNTKELKTASMTRHFGIPQIHRSEICALAKKLKIKRRLIDSMEFISNKNNNLKTFSFICCCFVFWIFFFTSWDTQPPFFVLSHVRSTVHIIAETCVWVRCRIYTPL